ncbi:MAG: AsmA-like C-terminal region-containing protein [Nitrospinota bacterium]
MPISKKRVIFYSFFLLFIGVFSIFSLAYYQLRNLDDVKYLAIEKMEELTGRKVSIGAAEMDIVRGLSVLLKDVSVKSRWDSKPELTARSVRVVVKLFPLLDKRVEVKKIIVQGSSLRVVRNASGQLSLGDVRKWISQPADSQLFKVLRASLMNQVMVEDGAIHFLDYLDQPKNKPLPLEMDHIHFSIRKSLINSPFQFALKGEIPYSGSSTAFKVSGGFDNFSEEKGFTGISINGDIRVNPLNVSRFQPYLKKVLAKTPANSWLSIDSSFSGSLGGALKTEGILKYSSDSKKAKAVLRDARIPHRGGLEYKISMDKDSINIEELKSESGPFKFKGSGSLKQMFSKNPAVHINLKTDAFQLNKSIDYLPLKIFPEEYHKVIHKTFKNGSVKINSLKFDGTVKELREIAKPENRNKISGEMEMRKVDWHHPLPPIKKVTGTFKVHKGNSNFHIQKARYENQPLNNLKGKIDNFLTHPVADLSLENEVDMAQFHSTLKKAFKGHPIHDAISVYSDFDGSAKLRLDVKGPLDDFDKLAIAGVIDFNSVDLTEEEFKPRIRNLNGKIIYTHTPEVVQRKSEPWIKIVQYKNLSGEFSNSKFSDLNGELGLSNGEPLEKATARYHLDSSDLHWIIGEDSEDALVALQEGLDFTSGGVLINYRFRGNPDKPETEKEWGKIELKNLSLEYRNRLKAMTGLKGVITYDEEKIRFENVSGLYGNSSLLLEGEIDRRDKSVPDFSLRLNLPELIKADLKDIPVFNDFEFSGPAHVSMNINGTPGNFKFEQQADLTRTGYKISDFVEKKENSLNQFKAKGSLTEKEGLDIENWVYELGGNKIAGSFQIPDLDSGDFSVQLASQKFQAYPSHRFSKSWSADGSIDFNISGKGNLNQIDSSLFEGQVDLINLKVKPENLSSDLIVNARLGFKEKKFDIRSASVASPNSRLDFSGVCQLGDSPVLDLKLKGEKLDINELMPVSKDKDTKLMDLFTRTEFFKQGKGQLVFDVGQLNFKLLHLNNVAGKVSLEDKTLHLKDWSVGTNPLVKSTGNMTIDENGVSNFEAKVQAKDVKTDNVFSLFGDSFNNSLSGDVKIFDAKIKGKGKNWEQISRSLSGKISLDIQSGMMDTEKLKHGVNKLFGSTPGSLPSKEESPSSFKQLSGDFIPKDGVFETENFIYETSNRRTSIVGTFDLGKNQMDTVVGVAPLAKLDRFLTKIPLFGKILTAGDEKSLLKSYYTVKGDFDDPDISPIPFTSLGKKVVGIFQGILQTPAEILESLPKIETPSEPSDQEEPEN